VGGKCRVRLHYNINLTFVEGIFVGGCELASWGVRNRKRLRGGVAGEARRRKRWVGAVVSEARRRKRLLDGAARGTKVGGGDAVLSCRALQGVGVVARAAIPLAKASPTGRKQSSVGWE
jgi:hypothetical protein